ncbi:MAG: copper-binding protein [Burkholderiales bacterium]
MKRFIRAFILALASCITGLAWAQAGETKTTGPAASGLVREIDRAGSRIKIDHGPIPSIGMPGMTMTFKVRNPELLDQVKQGDQVSFEIERSGLGWIITKLGRK